MPDRGSKAGPDWARQDTSKGAMEFDIMEHLTRWGPHRYNIAMHWDGYGDQHKQTGSSGNYVQSDMDGYITVGLLWTPGSAVYYCNGHVVASWQDPRISDIQSFIIIETTTGGWDNNTLDDTKLPADYKIDYVKVWQRKDLASGVDGYEK
jgi:beta-glucanase (GH16 family)